MRIVQSKEEIKICETMLEKNLIQHGAKKIEDVTVNVKNGTGETNVFYLDLPKLSFWFCRRLLEENDNKWWNSFGLEQPQTGVKVTELCEVNVPLEGINNRLKGAFVEQDGRIYLTHRGSNLASLTGEFIHKNYQGNKIIVDGKHRILVGEITSENLPNQIIEFLNEIKRLKVLKNEKSAS
jgi:hypothetical protein